MNAFRHALLRIGLVVALIVSLAVVLGDRVRALEARVVAGLLRSVFGVDVESVVEGAILIEQFQACQDRAFHYQMRQRVAPSRQIMHA